MRAVLEQDTRVSAKKFYKVIGYAQRHQHTTNTNDTEVRYKDITIQGKYIKSITDLGYSLYLYEFTDETKILSILDFELFKESIKENWEKVSKHIYSEYNLELEFYDFFLEILAIHEESK